MSELEKFGLLGVPLPEIINSYKYFGDFDAEIKAIDAYLGREGLPEALRTRLELEKVIAEGMKKEFSVSEEEAFSWFCENYEDFKRETFEEMMNNGMLEWRYVKGVRHLSDSYRSSVSRKQRALYAARKDRAPYVKSEKVRLIHEAIDEMHEKGFCKRRIRIRQELSVNKLSERVGERIKVYLPFPAECDEQSDIILVASSHPCEIKKGGQTCVYIDTVLKEDEVFFVEYEYTLCIRYKKIDYDRVSAEQPPFVEGMSGELLPHIAFTPLIRETAKEICKSETNPLKKARLIYDYVTRYLRYSFMREYLTFENIPEFALTSTIGDCGVMALLFITLCRASGIPAGWQSGLSVYPNRASSHDWATFYIEPFGKLYADLSGGEDADEKEDDIRHDHYFGNLDPYRMIANNAFQEDFDPPSSFCRTDPYDNQSGEAEYNDRGLRAEELTRKKILIEYKKI